MWNLQRLQVNIQTAPWSSLETQRGGWLDARFWLNGEPVLLVVRYVASQSQTLHSLIQIPHSLCEHIFLQGYLHINPTHPRAATTATVKSDSIRNAASAGLGSRLQDNMMCKHVNTWWIKQCNNMPLSGAAWWSNRHCERQREEEKLKNTTIHSGPRPHSQSSTEVKHDPFLKYSQVCHFLMKGLAIQQHNYIYMESYWVHIQPLLLLKYWMQCIQQDHFRLSIVILISKRGVHFTLTFIQAPVGTAWFLLCTMLYFHSLFLLVKRRVQLYWKWLSSLSYWESHEAACCHVSILSVITLTSMAVTLRVHAFGHLSILMAAILAL